MRGIKTFRYIRVEDGLVMDWPMLRAWIDRQYLVFGQVNAHTMNYYGDKQPGQYDKEYTEIERVHEDVSLREGA